MPPQLSPSGGCCVTASLKLQISICHSGSSAASGLKGVHVKATSLQNKAIKKKEKKKETIPGFQDALAPNLSPDPSSDNLTKYKSMKLWFNGIKISSNTKIHSTATHSYTSTDLVSAWRLTWSWPRECFWVSSVWLHPVLPLRQGPTDVSTEGSQSAVWSGTLPERVLSSSPAVCPRGIPALTLQPPAYW